MKDAAGEPVRRSASKYIANADAMKLRIMTRL